MKTTYTIIEGYESHRIIEIVNDRLQQGWQLSGGLCFNSCSNRYAQAMVKHEPTLPIDEIRDQLMERG